jgi:hypothetical protein
MIALKQMMFVRVKDHGHTYKFYQDHCLLTKLVNMEIVRNIEVMLDQALNHSLHTSVLLLNAMSVNYAAC